MQINCLHLLTNNKLHHVVCFWTIRENGKGVGVPSAYHCISPHFQFHANPHIHTYLLSMFILLKFHTAKYLFIILSIIISKPTQKIPKSSFSQVSVLGFIGYPRKESSGDLNVMLKNTK